MSIGPSPSRWVPFRLARRCCVCSTLTLHAAEPAAVDARSDGDRRNLAFAWKSGQYRKPLWYGSHTYRELYSMAADGSDVIRLTHNDWNETACVSSWMRMQSWLSTTCPDVRDTCRAHLAECIRSYELVNGA